MGTLRRREPRPSFKFLRLGGRRGCGLERSAHDPQRAVEAVEPRTGRYRPGPWRYRRHRRKGFVLNRITFVNRKGRRREKEEERLGEKRGGKKKKGEYER